MEAAASQSQFRVVVVDARPLCDGLKTLRRLAPLLPCNYVPLAGAAAAMRGVTRVLLGASGVLSNGAVVAPSGTAMVAALAKSRRVPVIVVAESYKFTDRIQLDAIVHNELGASAEIARVGVSVTGEVMAEPQLEVRFRGDETVASLPFQVINLRYDLTPAKLVSMVATETGLLPPTSIPVLLRELRSEAEA